MEAVEPPVYLVQLIVQVAIRSQIAQLVNLDTKEPLAAAAKPVSIMLEPSVSRVEV